VREAAAGRGRQNIVPGRATTAALARQGRGVDLDLLGILERRNVPAHGCWRQTQDLSELSR